MTDPITSGRASEAAPLLSSLTERLRGVYRLGVNDGAGPLNGSMECDRLRGCAVNKLVDELNTVASRSTARGLCRRAAAEIVRLEAENANLRERVARWEPSVVKGAGQILVGEQR